MELSPMSETKTEQPKPETPPNLKALAQDAAIQEQGSGGFMSPGSKVKNKGGRPRTRPMDPQTGKPIRTKPETTLSTPQTNPQQSQPPPAPVIPTAKIVKPFVSLASKTAGRFLHPKAAMEPEEFEGISEAFGLVLDKWMPMIAGQYGPELLLVTSVGAYGMRLMALKKALDMQAEEQSQQPAQAQPKSQVDDLVMPDQPTQQKPSEAVEDIDKRKPVMFPMFPETPARGDDRKPVSLPDFVETPAR